MPTGNPGQPSATKRVEMTHGCGFKTDWPASYAKHAMACDGTKAATSGRIAARGGTASSTSPEGAKPERIRRTPPAAKRLRKAARRVVRPRKAKRTGRELAIVEPTALVIPVGTSARLTFLEQLRAARGRIDDAIVAVEGLG